jgi:hypothetical protein
VRGARTSGFASIADPVYRRFALGLMTTVYMINLMDRYFMGLVSEPIKQELKLTDSELGFLTGVPIS